jgi:cell division protein FtsN
MPSFRFTGEVPLIYPAVKLADDRLGVLDPAEPGETYDLAEAPEDGRWEAVEDASESAPVSDTGDAENAAPTETPQSATATSETVFPAPGTPIDAPSAPASQE